MFSPNIMPHPLTINRKHNSTDLRQLASFTVNVHLLISNKKVATLMLTTCINGTKEELLNKIWKQKLHVAHWKVKEQVEVIDKQLIACKQLLLYRTRHIQIKNYPNLTHKQDNTNTIIT